MLPGTKTGVGLGIDADIVVMRTIKRHISNDKLPLAHERERDEFTRHVATLNHWSSVDLPTGFWYFLRQSDGLAYACAVALH
jgi:hypothetical protein